MALLTTLAAALGPDVHSKAHFEQRVQPERTWQVPGPLPVVRFIPGWNEQNHEVTDHGAPRECAGGRSKKVGWSQAVPRGILSARLARGASCGGIGGAIQSIRYFA